MISSVSSVSSGCGGNIVLDGRLAETFPVPASAAALVVAATAAAAAAAADAVAARALETFLNDGAVNGGATGVGLGIREVGDVSGEDGGVAKGTDSEEVELRREVVTDAPGCMARGLPRRLVSVKQWLKQGKERGGFGGE
jgi:hypothetical protein